MKIRAVVASLLSIGALVTSINVSANEPIQPIKAAKVTNADMVELGKMLFFDPRLSKSGFISCNSCHNLSMGGTDNIPTSIGHKWQQGPINAPTVLNASMNLAQFWDGRAKDLKEQAGGPIANPGEMASTHKVAVEVLQSIPQYRAHFAKAFGSDQVDIDRVTTAIAAFEETLVTPGSRFDKWLDGDKKALNAQEVEGYELFKSSGCAGCHNGPAVGGALYQKFGVHHPYKTASKAEGRKAVTGKDTDLNVFKVPTLRNIELTYPYFHDGAAATLEDAVKTMGKIQLDRDFNKKEIDSIVAFLKTLTGDQPDIKVPVLPPSNNNTPRPVPF
ncbi:MAG: cytochrome-c peroxidase [Nitrosomonas sp.]|uniref:cytochrome-c peroxidase n=1 Tax=Nitrosomonas sp. TaxID=42353 RepID=UPI0025CF2369|nr:cytochrome-c peroxidase [Nitrosomonas sp.]MCG7755758.1 cytochrome-c peroxidase [Nitrosomonas sp.]UJP03103.1 MAG: cytochrome-c peroxidase [Nitrosomonas sp.]UJP07900.1 MAG: cytochrome-c peroxidase [Nitrosomonas sp.]